MAVAQAAAEVERQKAHVVSRLYQVTYGAEERCRPQRGVIGLGKALDQFNSAFPELMRLIDGSPYLPPARDQFRKFLTDPSAKVSNEALGSGVPWAGKYAPSVYRGPWRQRSSERISPVTKKVELITWRSTSLPSVAGRYAIKPRSARRRPGFLNS